MPRRRLSLKFGECAFSVAAPKALNNLALHVCTAEYMILSSIYPVNFASYYSRVFLDPETGPQWPWMLFFLVSLSHSPSTKAFSFHDWSSSNFAHTILSTIAPCQIFNLSPELVYNKLLITKIALRRSQQQQQQQWQSIHDCPHGLGAYRLSLVMGQHVEIIAKYIGDTDIIWVRSFQDSSDSYAWLFLLYKVFIA